MGVIHVIDRAGERHTLEALEGWRVMEIIRDWGLPDRGSVRGRLRVRDLPRLRRPRTGSRGSIRRPTRRRDQLDTVPLTQPTRACPARSSGRPSSTGSKSPSHLWRRLTRPDALQKEAARAFEDASRRS